MTLDAATRRNLELTETLRGGMLKGSLLGVLDQTVTPMGKRLMRQWVSKPLLDVERIRHRQDGVESISTTTGMLRAELRAALKPLGDLERLTNRVVARHMPSRATWWPCARPCSACPALQRPAARRALRPLWSCCDDFHLCADELQLLEAAIADDPPATLQNVGVIRPGYSAELDGVVERSRHAREWIANLESGRARAHRHQNAQGGLQQGLWLLHRNHPRQRRARRRQITSANRPWSTPSATSPRR